MSVSQLNKKQASSDNNFVLEIYSTEIPTTINVRQMIAKMENDANKIFHIKYGIGQQQSVAILQYARVYITTYRVILTGYCQVIDLPKHIKGPRIGAEEEYIDAFCNKYQIAKDMLIKDHNHYYAVKQRDINTIMEEYVPQYVEVISCHWKNPMTIGGQKWFMPIRSILCILNDSVIKFRYTNVESGRITFGNKIIKAQNTIKIKYAKDYQSTLMKNNVEIDHHKRIEMISYSIKKQNKKMELRDSGTVAQFYNSDTIERMFICVKSYTDHSSNLCARTIAYVRETMLSLISEWPQAQIIDIQSQTNLPDCIMASILIDQHLYMPIWLEESDKLDNTACVISDKIYSENATARITNSIQNRIIDTEALYNQDVNYVLNYQPYIENNSDNINNLRNNLQSLTYQSHDKASNNKHDIFVSESYNKNLFHLINILMNKDNISQQQDQRSDSEREFCFQFSNLCLSCDEEKIVAMTVAYYSQIAVCTRIVSEFKQSLPSMTAIYADIYCKKYSKNPDEEINALLKETINTLIIIMDDNEGITKIIPKINKIDGAKDRIITEVPTTYMLPMLYPLSFPNIIVARWGKILTLISYLNEHTRCERPMPTTSSDPYSILRKLRNIDAIANAIVHHDVLKESINNRISDIDEFIQHNKCQLIKSIQNLIEHNEMKNLLQQLPGKKKEQPHDMSSVTIHDKNYYCIPN